MKAGSPGRPALGGGPPRPRHPGAAKSAALALAFAATALLLVALEVGLSQQLWLNRPPAPAPGARRPAPWGSAQDLALAVPAFPAAGLAAGLPGPAGGEGGDAFLRGAWLEPGRQLSREMKTHFAPTKPLTIERAVARWGETTRQVVEDPGGWEPAAGPGGSEVLWLRRPLNRNGTAGPAGSRRPSPGCAGLERVFRDYLDEPERRDQFIGDSLRSKPLMCVDVDMAAASPLVLSTPSFSGKYALDDFLVEGKLVDRGGNQAVPFLLAAVLPLLPADAKGSFVLSFADIRPVQAPDEDLQRRFHANGTPFLLHASTAWTPWVGGLPEYDTIKGQADQKIREVLAVARDRPVPWGEKADRVVYRGGQHGSGPAALYEGRLAADELAALLDPAGREPGERLDALVACGRTIPRLELAIWANSPANPERGRLDVQLTKLDDALERAKPNHPCNGVTGAELGLAAQADVEYVADTEWGANKAFFVVDGFGAAFSFRNKLALDAVVLKLASPLKLEFERFLLPGVHYVPFTMRNATEAVRYVLAEENAAEMQAMVKRAHAVMAERMGLEKAAERVRDDLVRLWRDVGTMPPAARRRRRTR